MLEIDVGDFVPGWGRRSAPTVPGMSAKTAHKPLELKFHAQWTFSTDEYLLTDNSRGAIVIEGYFGRVEFRKRIGTLHLFRVPSRRWAAHVSSYMRCTEK